jgi:hypothetical protein
MIVGFVLHVLVILLGAKIARIDRAGFWNCAAVALLSYVVMWVARLLVFPLMWLPVISSLVAAFILFLGTAIAIKLIFDAEWNKAWTVGIVVFVVNFLTNLLFSFSVLMR